MRGGSRRKDSDMPVRPTLPVTLPCAFCVWAAVWWVGQSWDGGVAVPVLVVPVASLAIAALMAGKWFGKPAALLFAALAASWTFGFVTASLHFVQQDAAAVAGKRQGVSSFAYVVQTDPRTSSYGSVRFRARAVPREGVDAPSFDVWVSLSFDSEGSQEVPYLGEVLDLRGAFVNLNRTQDYEASLYLQGCALTVRAIDAGSRGFASGCVGAVRSFRAQMLSRLGPLDEAAPSLIAGVAFGDQAAVAASGVSDTFSKLGLSHLVAVSGSHLALVASLASALVARARLRPSVRSTVLVALLAFYVCLTGFQLSALRAFVMSAVGLLAAVVGRRSQGLASIGLAALVLVLVSPACVFSLGFQLSVASVFALVMFGRLVQSWMEALLPRRCPQGLVETLSLTLLAQAATMPMTLPVFGTVPVLSPLANVVFVPLVSIVLLAGLVWCVLAPWAPPLAAAVLWVAQALSAVVCRAADGLAGLGAVAPVVDLGDASLWAPFLVAAALVYAVWPSPSPRVARRAFALVSVAAILAFTIVVIWPVERMVVLDIGQGDAILLQSGGAAVLVDTGPDDAVLAALARQHVWKLDAVVITHTDLDHAGGLVELVGHVGVDRVVFAQGVWDKLVQESSDLVNVVQEGLHAQVGQVCAGDTLRARDLTLSVLWPQGPVAGDENVDSIVILATWGNASASSVAAVPAGIPTDASQASGTPSMTALLTGDAESEVVAPLIERGAVGHADVLKVGHHGSAVSTTPEMVRGLSAQVGVASAGKDNSYGHPRQECIDAVLEGGARFVCTATAGDVTFYPQVDAIRVSCARELPFAA